MFVHEINRGDSHLVSFDEPVFATCTAIKEADFVNPGTELSAF